MTAGAEIAACSVRGPEHPAHGTANSGARFGCDASC
jgi:hypothetical protein